MEQKFSDIMLLFSESNYKEVIKIWESFSLGERSLCSIEILEMVVLSFRSENEYKRSQEVIDIALKRKTTSNDYRDKFKFYRGLYLLETGEILKAYFQLKAIDLEGGLKQEMFLKLKEKIFKKYFETLFFYPFLAFYLVIVVLSYFFNIRIENSILHISFVSFGLLLIILHSFYKRILFSLFFRIFG